MNSVVRASPGRSGQARKRRRANGQGALSDFDGEHDAPAMTLMVLTGSGFAPALRRRRRLIRTDPGRAGNADKLATFTNANRS